MSLPLDPVYCRKCKAQIPPDLQICNQCSWDQVRIYVPPPPQKPTPFLRVITSKFRHWWKGTHIPKVVESNLNDDSRPLFEEITRQYRALVMWQIAGGLIILDGPVLLIFLILFHLLPAVLIGSVIFPTLVSFIPFIALGGFFYAFFRKPILRQKVAEIGVDARQWSRPMDFMILKAILCAIAFTFVIVVACLVYGRTHPDEMENARGSIAPQTLYNWSDRR